MAIKPDWVNPNFNEEVCIEMLADLGLKEMLDKVAFSIVETQSGNPLPSELLAQCYIPLIKGMSGATDIDIEIINQYGSSDDDPTNNNMYFMFNCVIQSVGIFFNMENKSGKDAHQKIRQSIAGSMTPNAAKMLFMLNKIFEIEYNKSLSGELTNYLSVFLGRDMTSLSKVTRLQYEIALQSKATNAIFSFAYILHLLRITSLLNPNSL